MTDSGTVDRHEFGGVTAAIRARRHGGHVLATRRGFRLLGRVSFAGTTWTRPVTDDL